MLIANMGCYFFGLHQALTVMFSSQGSKVAVFGQSDTKSQVAQLHKEN